MCYCYMCGSTSLCVALGKRWSGLINIPGRFVIVMRIVVYIPIIQDTVWVSDVVKVNERGRIAATHLVKDRVRDTRIILTERRVINVMLVISLERRMDDGEQALS